MKVLPVKLIAFQFRNKKQKQSSDFLLICVFAIKASVQKKTVNLSIKRCIIAMYSTV